MTQQHGFWFRRYLRTRVRLYRQKRLTARQKAEAIKLAEQAELWRRKCESQQVEFANKLLALLGTTGIRPTVEESRLNELTDASFKQPEKAVKLYDTLTADEKAWYDNRFEAHRQRGKELGYTDAEIESLWKEHEIEEIAQIREESFITS